MILIISKKKGGKMDNIKDFLNATTKITSLGCGNQKGWFTNTVNAPHKMNINS